MTTSLNDPCILAQQNPHLTHPFQQDVLHFLVFVDRSLKHYACFRITFYQKLGFLKSIINCIMVWNCTRINLKLTNNHCPTTRR